MLVGTAKAVAMQWVTEDASRLPGYVGAFFHGSSTWLDDAAALPAASDLDVVIVSSEPVPGAKRGKFAYHGVVLDVAVLPDQEFRSADQILGQSHLAGSLRLPSVIHDPTGRLTAIQADVQANFARRHWVERRCLHVANKIRFDYGLRPTDPFHEQVVAWLFPVGITTHLLLVAGLRNPTVRSRYVATRSLLAEHDRLDFYEVLLHHLGCAHFSPAQTERHLHTLDVAFEIAAANARTPFPFSADISALGRSIAIDGSRDLIDRGLHREAVFWMVATYARCQAILHADAPPAVQQRCAVGFHLLLAELGISSALDLAQRRRETENFVPDVWRVAQRIMNAHPDILA